MLNDKSTKVPMKRFHLNADTIRFRPQNKKLQLPYPIVAVVKEWFSFKAVKGVQK